MLQPLLRGIAPLCLILVALAPLPGQQPRQQLPGDRIHLKFATFDPAISSPSIPPALRGDARTRLWIVQFRERPTDAMRDAVHAAGATIHGYLPDHSYVVRMPGDVASRVRARGDVRWAGIYHPAYRLEDHLLAEHRDGRLPSRRYNIVVVDKHTDKPGLIAGIGAIGGRIEHEQPGSILLEATLTGDQLLRVAHRDEVLWIDRWTPSELDMDNARTQGGGNYIESMRSGYTGQGIRGHVYEGIESQHQDFNTSGTNVQSCGTPERHGHCTAGIIFGNGTSNPSARGMAPDAIPYYTTRGCVTPGMSRWQVIGELVNLHSVMFTSASWGHTRTTQYTSISADTDDIIFDHDIPWTQSQSNAGNQNSRPQAWAKNIIAVGGVKHFDNNDPLDDSWAAGGASIGPATDGRIKPDLCAYYDSIHTSDLTGTAGYTEGNSYTRFSGTSGATPIVAGHNALALQMFTDGLFGNALRVPGGTRFQNRPHATTLKALQIANARQYAFTTLSSDNRREHQGWGFPDLRSMYDNRDAHVIIDETDVLRQGAGTRWTVDVAAGRSELKISMAYADPAGNPSSLLARINDLTLRVISPSGVEYFGNHGLTQGNVSTPGGKPDILDTVENVFVQNPEPGTWMVDVLATLVAQDGHVETPEVDADYALVVNGAVQQGQGIPIVVGSFVVFGDSCMRSGAVGGPGCVVRNEALPPEESSLLSPGIDYAIELVPATDLTVSGFEVRFKSLLGTPTVATLLYADDGTGQPGQVLASGSMVVGTQTGWYATTFASPVAVAAGTRVFLGMRPSVLGPFVPNTTGPPNMRYMFLSGGTWNGFFDAAWSYRVNCRSGAALEGTGTPGLGRTYSVSLVQGPATTPVAVSIGSSNTSWQLGSLPFPLGPFGAPGCSILASPDLLLGRLTDAQGNVTVPLRVPPTQSLLGGRLFHQFLVLDAAANPLGMTATNGGAVVVGH